MKKFLFALLLTLTSYHLHAKSDSKPYFSEFRGNGWIIYFSGNIPDDKEGEVKILQTQYLEGFNTNERRHSEWQLNKLGIKITAIPDNYYVPSEQTYPYEHPPHHAPNQIIK